MKDIIKKILSLVGEYKGYNCWNNGEGLTIYEPDNYDIADDVMKAARAVGVEVIINKEPRPNPNRPGTFFRPGVTLMKHKPLQVDRILEILG